MRIKGLPDSKHSVRFCEDLLISFHMLLGAPVGYKTPDMSCSFWPFGAFLGSLEPCRCRFPTSPVKDNDNEPNIEREAADEKEINALDEKYPELIILASNIQKGKIALEKVTDIFPIICSPQSSPTGLDPGIVQQSLE